MIGSALDIDFIIEGDDIFLECVVDANPPVEKLSWFRNVSSKTALDIGIQNNK